MSYGTPRKICRAHCKNPSSKYYKKVSNKYRRTRERQDPENAPTKNIYYDYSC